jgi:hypothetical protein
MCSCDEERLFFLFSLPEISFRKKLVASQQNVTGLQTMNCYVFSQTANAEKTPLYFDML